MRALLLADVAAIAVLAVMSLTMRSGAMYAAAVVLGVPLALYARWWLRTWAERQ